MMDLFKKYFISKTALLFLIICVLIGLILFIFGDFSAFLLAMFDVLLPNALWKSVWKYAAVFIFGEISHEHFCTRVVECIVHFFIIALVLGCLCYTLFKFNKHKKTFSKEQLEDKENTKFNWWSIWPKMGKLSPDKSSKELVVSTVWDSGLMSKQLNRVASFRRQQPRMTVSPTILAADGFFFEEQSSGITCFRCQGQVPNNNMANYKNCHMEGCQFSYLNCDNYSQSLNENQDTMMHQQLSHHRAQLQHQPAAENEATAIVLRVLSPREATLRSAESHLASRGGRSGNALAGSQTRHRLSHHRAQLQHQPAAENEATAIVLRVLSPREATLRSAESHLASRGGRSGNALAGSQTRHRSPQNSAQPQHQPETENETVVNDLPGSSSRAVTLRTESLLTSTGRHPGDTISGFYIRRRIRERQRQHLNGRRQFCCII